MNLPLFWALLACHEPTWDHHNLQDSMKRVLDGNPGAVNGQAWGCFRPQQGLEAGSHTSPMMISIREEWMLLRVEGWSVQG